MNQLIHGDCIESLKRLPASSVDLICTHPPYGIGFMGKAWDTFTPKKPLMSAANASTDDHSARGRRAFHDFMRTVSNECLRVPKPGAFMFVTMTPRQWPSCCAPSRRRLPPTRTVTGTGAFVGAAASAKHDGRQSALQPIQPSAVGPLGMAVWRAPGLVREAIRADGRHRLLRRGAIQAHRSGNSQYHAPS